MGINDTLLTLGDDAPIYRHYIQFTDLSKSGLENDLDILSLREHKVNIDSNNNEIRVTFRVDIGFNILNTLDRIREITAKTNFVFNINFLDSKQSTPCRSLSYYIEDLKYSLIPFDGKLELSPGDNKSFIYVYVTFKIKEKA